MATATSAPDAAAAPATTAAVGILGGSFDPVHHGHLRAAIEVREALGLAQMRLVPVNRNPHRRPPVEAAGARLALLEAAIGDSGLVVDRRELERGGTSYSIDTLESIRTEIGSRPLCMVVGGDALGGFMRWERWRDVMDTCHLVVASRPGATVLSNPDLAELLESTVTESVQTLTSTPSGHIHFLTIPLVDISSSDIRARIASQRSIHYLVPDTVRRLIAANGWYSNPA